MDQTFHNVTVDALRNVGTTQYGGYAERNEIVRNISKRAEKFESASFG
jgi:hypothetical protein